MNFDKLGYKEYHERFLNNKGHSLGSCYTHLTKKLCYVNIPKNLSSFVKAEMLDSNWILNNYYDINVNKYKFLILLRPPIDRWCSGVAEYLRVHFPNIEITNDILEIMCHQIVLDDHTISQFIFFENLPYENIDFIKVSKPETFYKLFNKWCHKNLGYKIENFGLNGDARSDKSKFRIKKQIKNLLNNDSKIKKVIFDYHEIDLERYHLLKNFS